MFPESKINTAQFSPQGAANVVGGMGDMANSALAPTEEVPQTNPQEAQLEEVGSQFRDAWKKLEFINGKFGGDVEKFRNLQKAAEDWFTTIAMNLPNAPQDNY